MSRCFPFPPPGYEKKPTTDDTDFLKKEKRKEKKHKKDKKDREKREGKEKKEERGEGKHKEKKDKHKNKKKDTENGKEKEKEKDKKKYSDKKRVDGQFESHNGKTLHQNNEHSKQNDTSSGHKKSSVHLPNGEHREQLLRKENVTSSDDKKSFVQSWGQKVKAEDIDNAKFVQELGRRIKDEEKGTGSLQFPVERRKTSDVPKMDGKRITNETTFGRVATVQNIINDPKPPFDKWTDRRVEEKEKILEKENDDKRGDKRTNKDRDKQRQGKDKDMEKDRKKEEKSELMKAERDKTNYTKNGDTIDSFKNLSTHSPKVSIQHSGSELKKRKDMETNGFSPENEARPNKMARPASSILTENGGLSQPGKQGPSMGSFKADNKERRVNGIIASQPMSLVSKKPPFATPNHILSKPTPTRSPISTDLISTKPPSSVPNPIVTQPLLVSKTKPSSTVTTQNLAQPLPNSKKKPPAEPLLRAPHPDMKYLKQILAVPKLEQWSGVDDQQWLYNSKDDPHFKKTTRDDSLQDNKELEVWSEAKNLESVDVCALPYVIPY